MNEKDVGPNVNISDFKSAKNQLWETIKNSTQGNGITCSDIENFLESIHITKLKAPAVQQSEFLVVHKI